MVQKVNQLLNDKAWARWTALVLIASMMFFGYMFVDVMSPIQALMESQKGSRHLRYLCSIRVHR